MTGNLQIKNNKYYAVLNLYENGKRKQKWICTGYEVKGNKRKAEKFLRDAITEQEQKSGLIRSEILFSDYVRLWLEKAKRRVDEVTYQGYENLAAIHVIPYFAEKCVKLQDVNWRVLQAYIDEKAAHGRKDGKGGLSARSLQLHKNILYQTLAEAVKNDLLPENPCQYIELPAGQRHESNFYTAEQMQQLFDAAAGDVLYPLIKITAIYGLRRSELLGLKWDSINFSENRLSIKHSVTKVMKYVEKDKTKSKPPVKPVV